MRPDLITVTVPGLGTVGVPSYFALLTLGFALAIILAYRDARRVDIDPNKIIDLSLYIIIFSIIGSRVLHVLFDGHLVEYINTCLAPHTVPPPHELIATGQVPANCTTDAQCAPHFLCNEERGHCHPARDCLLALKLWRGGLTYYGGFIFATVTTLVFVRRNKLKMWRVADLYGYGVPLGLFWGRMGCWLNGCCFGKVTQGPLGVVFPQGSPPWAHQVKAGLLSADATAHLPVHATQLYGALLNLATFFLVYFWLRPRKRFDGQVFWGFVMCKAVTRFIIELLRDDERGSLFGLLSTSQIISIGLFVMAWQMMEKLKGREAAKESTVDSRQSTVDSVSPEPPGGRARA